VGYGSIGKRHVKNILKISNHEVLVYSSKQGHKSKNRCEFCNSLEKCISKKPDAAIIANVSSNHIKIAEILAKNKIHLLIEKPLSNSLVGINNLLKLTRKNKLITLMGCNLRFHPCIKKIRELIQKNKIGRIISIQVENGSYLPSWHNNENYRRNYASRKELGGGVILTCIHEIDYLYWMFGKPKETFAVAGKFSDLDINVEDLASIIFKFNERKIAQIHLDYFQIPSSRGCKLIGTKGTILWNSTKNEILVSNLKNKKFIKKFSVKNYNIERTYIDEINHFLKCIKNNQITINPLTDGIETLKISLSVLKSAREKKVIKI